MMGWLQSVAGIVFIFGIVVFVHELGHFLAAKLANVYAPRFSIGFGPPLWRRRVGETEYVLAALPLGGYVRMASRDDEAAAFLEGGSEAASAAAAERGERPSEWDPQALVPFGPNPVPEHRWFESKSLPQRLFIMLAGVTMNALLSLAIMIGLAAAYGRVIPNTRVVGAVRPPAGNPGLAIALTTGDTILAVGGRPVRHWADIDSLLTAAADDSTTISTQRGEVRIAIGEPRSRARAEVLNALEWYVPPVIDSVLAGFPAARAGIRAGDSVVAVAGTPVRTFSDIIAKVGDAANVPLAFDLVDRAGRARRVVVRPEPVDAVDPQTGQPRKVGRIGAAPPDITVRQPFTGSEAVLAGTRATVGMAGDIFTFVRGLFTGAVSPALLGGPIAIATASANAARTGLQATLGLLALISINLAVFNLLPIPILDGGHIVLNLAESIKGRPFSDRTRDLITRAGLAAIALLFVVVMWNDISRVIRSHFG